MACHSNEFVRFIMNGIFATLVHFSVFSALTKIPIFGIQSAGLANFAAALFGITASFLGSRYFVFQNAENRVLAQAARFGGLYGGIAIFHGVALFVWTDYYGLDYRIGFLMATGAQVLISYFGNKFLVFR